MVDLDYHRWRYFHIGISNLAVDQGNAQKEQGFMIVHNITVKVDPAIGEQWKQWQVNEYIPAVMSTSLFTEYRFYKLLGEHEEGGSTYVIQFFANTAAQLNEYLEKHAPHFKEIALEKWGNQFIAFRTTMETVK